MEELKNEIIIRIKNGGFYFELPEEPSLCDVQKVIYLLEDFLYLLQKKYHRLMGVDDGVLKEKYPNM